MRSQMPPNAVTVWPRLWHNLRASRQTELEQQFPTHGVYSWLGNSERVAARHYWQVRDSDFERATEKRVQNPTQQVHARGGSARKHANRSDRHKTVLPHNAAGFRYVPNGKKFTNGPYRTRTCDLVDVNDAR